MCRQIDQGGHDALVGTIEELGLEVHCGARTESFVGSDGTTTDDADESSAPVAALRFSNEDWDDLPVQMVVAGVRLSDLDSPHWRALVSESMPPSYGSSVARCRATGVSE